jgi:hypothetical protein
MRLQKEYNQKNNKKDPIKNNEYYYTYLRLKNTLLILKAKKE